MLKSCIVKEFSKRKILRGPLALLHRHTLYQMSRQKVRKESRKRVCDFYCRKELKDMILNITTIVQLRGF